MFVVAVTDREVDGGCSIDFQRTGPVVITFGTETESSNTKLGVDVVTTNPKGSAEQRAGVGILGQVILCNTTVIPHVTITVNQSADIVDVKFSGTLSTLTCGRLGSNCFVRRSGFPALDTFTCRHRRREGNEQQGDQYQFAIYTFHLDNFFSCLD